MRQSYDAFPQSSPSPEPEYRAPTERMGIEEILRPTTTGNKDAHLVKAVLQPQLIRYAYKKIHGAEPASAKDLQEIAMTWSADTDSSPAAKLDRKIMELYQQGMTLQVENLEDAMLEKILKEWDITIPSPLH